jgi:hypothetical protein
MKTLKFLFTLIMVILLMSGCIYNFILPDEVIDPGDPDAPELSFAQDIIPIFTASNNCTGCHDTGGQMPDLTAANAYASLNSSRYINVSSPDQSKIYTWPHPDTDSHKQKKYTDAQAAKVLVWITQGAQNN